MGPLRGLAYAHHPWCRLGRKDILPAELAGGAFLLKRLLCCSMAFESQGNSSHEGSGGVGKFTCPVLQAQGTSSEENAALALRLKSKPRV